MGRLKENVASSFFSIHHDIKNNRYTHYVFKGGRGSTKSSFVAIEIILSIIQDSRNGIMSNAVALRKTANTLKDSVYAQLVWAIDILELGHLFQFKVSPIEIRLISTGQRIIFRGADDEIKLKSIKFQKGFCKYIWYEELDSFNGMEQIRSINQSLMRGGNDYSVFYSYNPPRSINSWVNAEMLIDRPDRIVHHSTYEKVPTEWLGDQFIIEAKHLEMVNIDKYRHEYLGEAVGTGGEVFTNVTLRKITDDEIKSFDKILRGIDWGYASDPFAYGVMHYDKTRKRLYIFFEIYKVRLSNAEAIELVKKENVDNGLITCDSAEPKSIREFRDKNVNARGARKGPNSIRQGIKWLQALEEIIIDPDRCPNATREFTTYELEKDRFGNFKSDYPDKNNHWIDLCRYATEDADRGAGVW